MWITQKKEEKKGRIVLHCVEKIYFCQILSTKIFLYNESFFPISFLNQNYVGITSTWNLCYHKRRRDQEDPGPYLRRKKLV